MGQLLHQTGLLDITPGNIVMIITGMVLLYLGIVKKLSLIHISEPTRH